MHNLSLYLKQLGPTNPHFLLRIAVLFLQSDLLESGSPFVVTECKVSELAGQDKASGTNNKNEVSDASMAEAEKVHDFGAAGRWTCEEHQKFLEALKLYGKNWKLVQKYVGTRSATQARSHAQKYFAKLEKMGLSKAAAPRENQDCSGSKTQASTPVSSPLCKPNLGEGAEDSMKNQVLKKTSRNPKVSKRLFRASEDPVMEPQRKRTVGPGEKVTPVMTPREDEKRFAGKLMTESELQRKVIADQLNPLEQESNALPHAHVLMSLKYQPDPYLGLGWDSKEPDLGDFQMRLPEPLFLEESEQVNDAEGQLLTDFLDFSGVRKQRTLSCPFE